ARPTSHVPSSALFLGARICGKRVRSFEIFDDRAEIYRFGIKRLVLGDLRAIQNFETVTFEHFFAAPAFERDDLAANAFFTGTIEVAEIRAHQRTRSRNFSGL